MAKTIFFRNDDVRDIVDEELIKLVELFVAANVPISLAVEPGNVTKEVVDWLLDQKKKHPNVIEIIQHGYDHNKRMLYPKGKEFGGVRGYEDQYADLKKGKEIMDSYFGDKWFPAMTFPYGSYNTPALQALDKLDFKVLTAGIDFSLKHRAKNFVGNVLSKDFILDKKVCYHNGIRKKYKLFEVDIAVSIIKKYLTVDKVEHLTLNEMIQEVENSFKYTSVVGILFHHRFHKDCFNEIKELIDWMKAEKYVFSNLETMNKKFSK